jgi:hypothetical protein
MSAKELVFGAAVKMFKGEPLQQLGYKKLGKSFQDSLQIGGGHLEVEAIAEISKRKPLTESYKKIHAAREREKYKSITREEMDKRNEAGRKGRANRRV